MFGILGSASDLGPVVQDCDNIDYVPLGDGTVYRDDPADQFSGVVPISSLPEDIQDAINDAMAYL